MLQGIISSEIVSQRLQYVNSMKRFVEEQKEKLDQTLNELGLSEELLNKIGGRQVCPYNKHHIIPDSAFKKHVGACRLLSSGHQRDELCTLLQDMDFWYQNAEPIMKIEIDESCLNKIIWDHSVQNGQVYTGHREMPVSYIDENINLTQEDRLAVYKYVVNRSHEAGKVIPVDQNDDLLTTDWGSLVKKGLLDAQNNMQYSSKLEQLAALRDMKRRRQSYRAKNVHITKKSYTEIIREVIVNQMEILVPTQDPNPPSSYEDGREDVNISRDTRKDRSYTRHRDKESHFEDRRESSSRFNRERDRSPNYRDKYYESKRSRDMYRDRDGECTDSQANYRDLPSYRQETGRISKEVDVKLEPSLDSSHDYEKKVRSSDERQEEDNDRGYADVERKDSRRKRKYSTSDSDSGEHSSRDHSRSRSRHKRSKHKKKHNKKHKRKD